MPTHFRATSEHALPRQASSQRLCKAQTAVDKPPLLIVADPLLRFVDFTTLSVFASALLRLAGYDGRGGSAFVQKLCRPPPQSLRRVPYRHRRNAKPKRLIRLYFFCSLSSLGRVVCTLFYAIMRPFTRQFDGSVQTERTRFGDVHQAQFRVLASPGAAERKIRQ